MSLQARALSVFTALSALRRQWGGELIVCAGLGRGGEALAIASLVAGAAALFLESDLTVLRAAQQRGCCDFAVTTLDEALRALKNEVRQRRAISIGLRCNPGAALAELVERGVLPAVLAAEAPLDASTLLAWGANPVHGFGLARLADESVDLEHAVCNLTAACWVLQEESAASILDRRQRDTRLASAYAGAGLIDGVMQQWLRTAPGLFPRDRVRSRWAAIGEGAF